MTHTQKKEAEWEVYLLRRIPPALRNRRVFLHRLVSDQLLTLALQFLNLTATNKPRQEQCEFPINYQQC